MIELFPLFWEEFEDNKKVLSKLTYLRGGGGGGIIKNGLWSDVIYGRSPGVLEFFRANWL